MKWIPIAFALFTLAACNSNPAEPAPTETTTAAETPETRNKKVIAEAYEAMQALTPSVMISQCADDVIDYGDGSMAPIKGKDSLAASMDQWLAAMESIKIEDLTMMADGNNVWCSGYFSGKYKADAWGLPTKGKSFRIFDVDMFTLNDEGKITSHRSVQGPEVWFGQMGIPMPKK